MRRWGKILRNQNITKSNISLYPISTVFCLLYIHINNIKFTYDKFKTAKFGLAYSICPIKFIKTVYFLDKHLS